MANVLSQDKPDFIFIQCGGNDIERFPNHQVIIEYELLINTIKEISPQSTIIIGAVPLRGKSSDLHNRIAMFNTYLFNRGKKQDGIVFLNAAPTDIRHFQRDQVHFNDLGAAIFQHNIVHKIQYLYSFPLLRANVLK